MTNVAPEETPQGEGDTNRVAKEFTRLYYHILNENPEYLHQFYGQTSAVTVSETQDDGANLTVRADTLELIKSLTLRMFGEVRVSLTNCTPQSSLSGSIQLLVSGVMHQKNCDEERLFTQALLLAKQDQGYFVLNDTVHVHSRSCSWKVLSGADPVLHAKAEEPVAEAEKGVVTPPQDEEMKQEAVEAPPEKAEAPPPAPVQEAEVTVQETEGPSKVEAAAPCRDEPVGPPTGQNVAPIEKPVATPLAPAPSPPATSVRKTYRDVLHSGKS